MQLLSHRRNIWVVERGPTRQSNLSSSVYVVEYVSSFFKTFTQLHSTFFACLAESLKTVLSAAYSAWSYTDDCSIKRGATLLLLYNVALLLVFLECFNSSGRRPAVQYERGGFHVVLPDGCTDISSHPGFELRRRTGRYCSLPSVYKYLLCGIVDRSMMEGAHSTECFPFFALVRGLTRCRNACVCRKRKKTFVAAADCICCF